MSNDLTGKHAVYYQTSAHLRAKHEQTQVISGRQFHAWALSQIPIQPAMHVLDAGCGWGRFTWHLVDHYGIAPANIVCTDVSSGMLGSVQAEAQRKNSWVKLCTCEIEALPFEAGQFDLVMANHVLYHVASLATGLSELARMLRPQGYFLATTNSENVRVTIIELHYAALRELGIDYEPEPPSSFSMESGVQPLEAIFGEVNVCYFADESIYPRVDDFVAQYRNIGRYRNFIARADIAQKVKDKLPRVFKELAQAEVDQEGELRVPSLMGAFVCREPRI